jgi:hypothetical protein
VGLPRARIASRVGAAPAGVTTGAWSGADYTLPRGRLVWHADALPVPLCDDGRLQRQLGRRRPLSSHLLSGRQLTLVQTPRAGASCLVAGRL